MRRVRVSRLIGLIFLIIMAVLAGFYVARFQLRPIWMGSAYYVNLSTILLSYLIGGPR